MTQKLQKLMRKAETWPKEVQDAAADSLQLLDQAYSGTYKLTAEDKKALARSARDVRLKRFASEKDIAAFFARARS
ncbi:MAG: hypothetical protein UY39_C0057G0004 [Candidatus Kaiserbacteria bacterium GW2011_GWC2_49_12]|uniref:Uncharacterized protein n=5 Tax=Parcubacteria group TaxID=1794811 RepID=A0A0G1WPA0_9BACT|nr:MAG: hypothetical protein UY39_C0057G0004 [Candidatus Kaiserbacteria bacterium GW2011_GWC2_49_12]KKW17116.1 MAG: hypothetical protein UY57_C0025G0004 [Candidatus Kaiserbacteria bacterium GW2011_GWB1_50_17]KKW17926.1 MAG: hypothetical protein UY59_C0021G0004 [Candidatus Kaiserbacteria bacterium GW2011_GWA1_50_28]KKW20415.1 MAG: hypothetical protein UY61_C0034G0004 [Candidatus Adlerbacteria bacterium GW2011_GWC1_50_9]OGG86971.1 MAG: hypothetical protein A3H15_00250 [Candidatus Kaiserbacteria b